MRIASRYNYTNSEEIYKVKIAITQKVVSFYRVDFFREISKKIQLSIFTYAKPAKGDVEELDFTKIINIRSYSVGGFLYAPILPLINGNYDYLVLQLNRGHFSTWLLLMTKWLHKKKIILWGQGISVKRYVEEEKKPDVWLRLMISMSDGVWIYMQKEAQQWRKIFPEKKIVALNNSLSGVDEMCEYIPINTKRELKTKYGIKEDRIIIYCARFTTPRRRTDILEDVIKSVDTRKIGFVIIGDGDYKPDFSEYPNVYEFGAVYDTNIKRDLFTIADLYFQPGWLGLSIVEAMAYGKPVCTFERSKYIQHGVEYAYIEDKNNGMIFKNFDECINRLTNTSDEIIKKMSEQAREFVKDNLSIKQMAANALSIL